jgi:hypothetical protein
MGSIGGCYDDAVIESFWGRMQTDLLNLPRWRTCGVPKPIVLETIFERPTDPQPTS